MKDIMTGLGRSSSAAFGRVLPPSPTGSANSTPFATPKLQLSATGGPDAQFDVQAGDSGSLPDPRSPCASSEDTFESCCSTPRSISTSLSAADGLGSGLCTPKQPPLGTERKAADTPTSRGLSASPSTPLSAPTAAVPVDTTSASPPGGDEPPPSSTVWQRLTQFFISIGLGLARGVKRFVAWLFPLSRSSVQPPLVVDMTAIERSGSASLTKKLAAAASGAIRTPLGADLEEIRRNLSASQAETPVMDPLLPLTRQFVIDLPRGTWTFEHKDLFGKVVRNTNSNIAPLSPQACTEHLRTACDGDDAWVTAVSRWANQSLPGELLCGVSSLQQGLIFSHGGHGNWTYDVRRDAANPYVEVSCTYSPGGDDPMRFFHEVGDEGPIDLFTLESAKIKLHVYPPAGVSDDASAVAGTRTYRPPTLAAAFFLPAGT